MLYSLRYAMRSTISDVEGTEDLCKMSPCGPHSICIPDTVSYRYNDFRISICSSHSIGLQGS